MWKKIIETIVYQLDPVFREWANKKTGPNDRVKNGEKVLAVLSRSDQTKKNIRGRR